MSTADIREMQRVNDEVVAAFKNSRRLLRDYIDSHKMISRLPPAKRDRSDHSPNATCTAFALYYIGISGLLTRQAAKRRVFRPANEVDAIAGLASELAKVAAVTNKSRQKRRTARARRATTRVAEVPNPYNTPIQLAGFLTAAGLTNWVLRPQDKDACKLAARYINSLVLRTGGWVSRLEVDAPSAYLTFWCGIALDQAARLNLVRSAKTLHMIAKFGEREVTNALAYHHAGFRSRVDVVESIYAALCASAFGPSADMSHLCEQLFTLLFTEYFDNGCFSPSGPVLADRHNYSLQCSTAEAASLMVNVAPHLLYNNWRPLSAVLMWLIEHRRAYGWSPEHEGRHSPENAFMTSASLAFMNGMARLLDHVSHRAAAAELLTPTEPPKPPTDYMYPGALAGKLDAHVIKPLKADPRRDDIASFSMILYGPPGTSKTTVAKKLAFDLGWPLFVVNQNSFMRQGLSQVDAEAERLFSLIRHLRDVVVLFDEVEELVEARHSVDQHATDKASRILTTSMLPRIHELRDLHRVVFIFATNHVDVMDDAAIRLGRFDIVHSVGPPTQAERATLLRTILDDLRASDAIRDAINAASIVENAQDFCYVDLHAMVRHLIIHEEVERKTVDKDLATAVMKIYKRRVESDAFKQSLKRTEDFAKGHDRP
jgi:hypothetical protein